MKADEASATECVLIMECRPSQEGGHLGHIHAETKDMQEPLT